MQSGFGMKFAVSFTIMILLVGTIAPAYSLHPNIPSNVIDQIDTESSLPGLPVEHVSEQKEPPFASNQLIVGFKQDVTKESIEDFYREFQSNFGLDEKKDLSAGNANTPITKLIKTSIPVNSKIIEKLQSDPRVEFVEPDYIISINTNDTYYNLLWGLENTGQSIRGNTGTSDADIDAPEAWTQLNNPPKVLVGIIDSGVDYNHEDLSAHIWTNPGETGLDVNGDDKSTNGIDDDGNGYIDDVHGYNTKKNNGDPMDDNGHGTHVAGTIGAVGDNGKGIVGVSQYVEIIACKFLDRNGRGFTSDAIDCFNYFNQLKLDGHNVRVTNNSWGGGGFSTALLNAMDSSILHVTAAGNSGVNVDTSPHYPSSYNLDNIISVAATDFNDDFASFSNYGNTVDIAAPGVDIASTWTKDRYYWSSGTSMAAPHVTGAAALAWSANPNLSTADVKSLIMGNGDTISPQSKFTGNNLRLNVDKILSQTSTIAAPVITTASGTVGSSPVTIDGTAEADSTVELFLDGVTNGTTTATGGVWQFTGVALSEGDNSFTATAFDGINTSAASAATIITLDTTPPIITVNPTEVDVELNSSAPVLLDGVTTDDGSPITTTGTVDPTALGDYIITYDSTDGTNAATPVTRTYHVVDTTPPIITVNPTEVDVELNSSAPVLLDGVTTDDGSPITTTGTVDPTALGDYIITYDSTDGTNAATPVTRTYHVVDTTPPIITLTGANPQTIELGSGYTELGATTDDGSPVVIDATAFIDAVGSYNILYDSTDGTNAATTVIRVVDVVDTTALTDLSVTVTTDSPTDPPTYTPKSFANITVEITDGLNAVSGASITFTVTAPDGKVKTQSGTTDDTGKVTFKYRISPKAASGDEYVAAAIASATGYNSGNGSITFTIL